MKRLAPLFAALALCFATVPAQAQSDLSEASALGASVVVLGSMSMLAASGEAVVRSVEAAGEGSVIVLEGVAGAASATIQLSGQAAKGLSVAAGTVVKVSVIATGHVLILAGKVIAFIPNEIGKGLLHQSRAGQGN